MISLSRGLRLPAVVVAVVTSALVMLVPADAVDAPTCRGRAATIVGTSFDDELLGTPRRDVIVGLGGADLIRARGGDDLICGGDDHDEVHGGNGDDRVFGQGDTIYPEDNRGDRFWSDPGDDLFQGGDEGAFDLWDSVRYRREDSAVAVDLLQERAHGEHSGHDVLRDIEAVVGTPFPDILLGGMDDELLWGSGGGDVITGSYGDDYLAGVGGPDEIRGGTGHDQIQGNAAADVIWGGSGPDFIDGRRHADKMRGGRGRDSIAGGSGNDRLRGGPGVDHLDGGAGRDLCYVDDRDRVESCVVVTVGDAASGARRELRQRAGPLDRAVGGKQGRQPEDERRGGSWRARDADVPVRTDPGGVA